MAETSPDRCPICGASRYSRLVEIRTIVNGGAIEHYEVICCKAQPKADHVLNESCVLDGCLQSHAPCDWPFEVRRAA